MIRGPIEYVPSVEVEVLAQRAAIPLDENEGIYVRDVKSGKVFLFFREPILTILICIINTILICTE